MLVAVLVVLGGGCQVRTDVELAVARDGSGTVAVTVTLDKEAAAQVPNLAAQLRVDDLRKAGWQLTGPRRTSGGAVVVSARKRFGRPEQAGAVLEELAGRGGPFRGFAVTRTHSFARTTWAARGTVDLSRGLAAFSDQRLTALLGGKPFGRSDAELRFMARGSVADAAPFRVRVRLPEGQVRAYDLRLGDRPLRIDSHVTKTARKAYLLAGAAVAAVVVAVALYLLGGRRRRKPPRAQRGMGTYDRRRFQAITDVEEGPPPGTGGAPELVRVRRPPRPGTGSGGPGRSGTPPQRSRPGTGQRRPPDA